MTFSYQDDNTDWERLRSITEEEIDEAARSDPDNPPLDGEFFKRAKRLVPPRKKDIHIYVDEDVLAHFKKQGRGYQTRMNAVLRAFMDHDCLLPSSKIGVVGSQGPTHLPSYRALESMEGQVQGEPR